MPRAAASRQSSARFWGLCTAAKRVRGRIVYLPPTRCAVAAGRPSLGVGPSDRMDSFLSEDRLAVRCKHPTHPYPPPAQQARPTVPLGRARLLLRHRSRKEWLSVPKFSIAATVRSSVASTSRHCRAVDTVVPQVANIASIADACVQLPPSRPERRPCSACRTRPRRTIRGTH